jgi:alkylation response protein AidB-like acyl-CoA dehydrogenase
VPFAPDVTWLLAVGTTAAGTRLLLLPAGHAGVDLRRHDDIGRGDFYEVTVREVDLADTIDLSGADGAGRWAAALLGARIRHAAYLLGLARAAFDEVTAYARERRQFGQAIGRFQSVAFRLADAATRLSAAELLVFQAAWQVDTGADARLAALEALVMAAELARLVGTEAVQLHGAVGMTEDHDAQLCYRRVAVDALLLGRPTQLRRAAASILTDKYQ